MGRKKEILYWKKKKYNGIKSENDQISKHIMYLKK